MSKEITTVYFIQNPKGKYLSVRSVAQDQGRQYFWTKNIENAIPSTAHPVFGWDEKDDPVDLFPSSHARELKEIGISDAKFVEYVVETTIKYKKVTR